jgi:hypothetical protein
MTIQTRSHKVGIVVDRNFGDRIQQLARLFHVWVVESPSNTPVIQKVWEAQSRVPDLDILGPGVTSFGASSGETAEDMCARIASEVQVHHGEFGHDPPWAEIEIHGVQLDDRLGEVFRALGTTEFEAFPEGFICRRRSNVI